MVEFRHNIRETLPGASLTLKLAFARSSEASCLNADQYSGSLGSLTTQGGHGGLRSVEDANQPYGLRLGFDLFSSRSG